MAQFAVVAPVPRDRLASRDRWSRRIFFLIALLLIFGLPTLFMTTLVNIVDSDQIKYGVLAGLAMGVVIFAWASRRLLIYVREWGAAVTNDASTGEVVPYGSGWHPTFPWEMRTKNRTLSLRIMTARIRIAVQTESSEVIAVVNFQYQFDLRAISRSIGADVSTIQDGYSGLISSFLTEQLAAMSASEARGNTHELTENLKKEFEGLEDEHGMKAVDFEKKYGLITRDIRIETFDLPPEVKKTRNAQEEGSILFAIIANLLHLDAEVLAAKIASGAISMAHYEKLLNRAMAISENADMSIQAFEGELPAAFMAAIGKFAGVSEEKGSGKKKKGH